VIFYKIKIIKNIKKKILVKLKVCVTIEAEEGEKI